MLPARLDVTLAFKHIALSEQLTGTEKRVASAILDSFNRRDGQCDPSFDRIAHVLQLSRRTVIRAIHAVERSRLLSRVRHGGKFHRNQYQPNWLLFREFEKQWVARKKTRHWQSSAESLSPSPVPGRGTGTGDDAGTQTIPFNHSLSTSDVEATTARLPSAAPPAGAVGHPRKIGIRSFSATVSGARSTALRAAERRWNEELHRRMKDNVALYAQAIESIDDDLREAATAAEMAEFGSGLTTILTELQHRGVRL